MHSLIIAAAGSGKTTHIVKHACANKDRTAIILTFTNENEEGIKNRFYSLIGCIPGNIKVQSWFAFVMQHGVRPYQGKLRRAKIYGMLLVSGKSALRFKSGPKSVFWPESDTCRHYFDVKGRIFSDKISKFMVRCNESSGGLVVSRIKKQYDCIYIDEVQDFAGYDLEILKLLIAAGVSVHMVGDPRQATYKTHYDDKYKKYSCGKIAEFIKVECEKFKIRIDDTTLNISHRNSPEIVAISSMLYPELPTPKSGNRESGPWSGVYFISESSIDAYLDAFHPMQLRLRIDSKNVRTTYPATNFGKSKGREYDRVLIFPTDDMAKWLCGRPTDLKPKTRSQLYVALTRAKCSVAIVLDTKAFDKMPRDDNANGIPIKSISL